MKYSNLFGFIFWFNPHQDLWYAIDRDTQLEFFNGNREKSTYYASKEINTLIEMCSDKDTLERVLRETSTDTNG
jgi:hypothetical protein